MKLAHLQIKDVFNNRSTLLCHLINGSIKYTWFIGWSSNGLGKSISDFPCKLPIEKITPNETKEEFVKRLIKTINSSSCNVINEIDTNITF